MKLIMENWREYINEIGMSRAALGMSDDEYKKTMQPVKTRPISQLSKQEIYDIISFIDPTSLTAYPEAAISINDFKKDPSWWNAGMVSLSLLALIPVGGKIAKVGKLAALANKIKKTSKDVATGLKRIPGGKKLSSEIEVALPSSGQMKKYIEKNREMGRLGYVDDGSRAAQKKIRIAQAKGIPDEILKKVSSRTHPSLSKYKFSRLKPGQFPKTVYHGSRGNQLSIDKISPLKRPRGKDAFDAHWDDAAGFYTHSIETLSNRYAKGKKATMYNFEVNPNAKVYAYTPPKGEKYQEGWHFIRLNNKDIQALRKKGVDALYDKVADEFIVIGNPKKVFSKIKAKSVID